LGRHQTLREGTMTKTENATTRTIATTATVFGARYPRVRLA